MYKKGQFLELFGILIVVGIVVVGTVGVYISKDSTYVGDITTLSLYKYSDCKSVINKLPKENMKVYTSKDLAESDGFNIVGCE